MGDVVRLSECSRDGERLYKVVTCWTGRVVTTALPRRVADVVVEALNGAPADVREVLDWSKRRHPNNAATRAERDDILRRTGDE